jgi:hypothetical protein
MPVAFIGTLFLIIIVILVLAVIGLFSLISRGRKAL